MSLCYAITWLITMIILTFAATLLCLIIGIVVGTVYHSGYNDWKFYDTCFTIRIRLCLFGIVSNIGMIISTIFFAVFLIVETGNLTIISLILSLIFVLIECFNLYGMLHYLKFNKKMMIIFMKAIDFESIKSIEGNDEAEERKEVE